MLIDLIHRLTNAYYRFFYRIMSYFCDIAFVVSDSHSAFNPIIISRIKNNKILIHSGDWSSTDDYEYISGLFDKVYGVRGNTETVEIDNTLPEYLDFEINGKKIHLIHELEYFKKYTQTKSDKYDIVIFGHTHKPYKRRLGGVMFINPGSCGPKRYHNQKPSYAVIYFFKNFIIVGINTIRFTGIEN